MCHGRLHAHPEDVELQQAHLLDVVLVEVAHREAGGAAFHRSAIEQRGVGQHDAARMQGDVPGQAVESLHQVEEGIETTSRCHSPETGSAQLRKLGKGVACVTGTNVREGGGEGVDLGGRHAEGSTHIAHSVTHAVGLHHRHGRRALGAEPIEDPAVDLLPSRRLDVDVDVGQGTTQGRQEALHEQALREGVDSGDAEQVVDQAAGAGTARSHAHAPPADHVDHLCHSEEVAGELQVGDGAHLLLESTMRLPTIHCYRVPARDGLLASGPQHDGGTCIGLGRRHLLTEQHVKLGHEHLAKPEVGLRIEHAELRQPPGVVEQLTNAALPCHRGYLRRDGRHLLIALQEGLTDIGIDVPGVQRHQATCGVEHIGDAGVPRVQVPDRIGEDDREMLLPGPAEHRGCRLGGVRMPARAAVGGDRDPEPAVEDRPPGTNSTRRTVDPLRGDQPPHLGVGRQQGDETLVMRTQVGPGHMRLSTLAAHVRVRDVMCGRHQPAQGGPPSCPGGQEQHARSRIPDPATTVSRCASR